MADREPKNISPAYRRRIERRLGGLTYEQAIARGISLQRARGHRPREHIIREQRRRERGALTEADRAFLRRQAMRSIGERTITIEAILNSGHENAEKWAEAVEIYSSLPDDFRKEVRRVNAAAVRFHRNNPAWRWDTNAPMDFPPFPMPPDSPNSRIYYYH